MELTGLATLLQKQIAASSSIVLDSTILDVSMLDEIRTAFALPAGTDLTIAGLTPEDVPTPTADGVLALPTGTATGLNQSNIGMTVTFTEAGGTLQVIIVAVMREAWRFTDSFGDLTVFPFPSLLLIMRASSSRAQRNRPMPGPANRTTRLPLSRD